MKNTIYYLIPIIVEISLFLSCNSNYNAQNDKVEQVKKQVENWNNAHNSRDVSVLSNLYNSSVLYYGITKEKNDCIESKLKFFNKFPDFHQQIDGDVQIEELSETEIKCTFIKRVTINQETKDYPSYLVFVYNNNEWYIDEESDLVTDKNLQSKKMSKTTKKEEKVPDYAVQGDYDGDGTTEYMWIEPPKIKEDYCEGECDCYIMFSNKNIPSIKITTCIGGDAVNEGDLNDDGSDEIGILPNWWTSCWGRYEVFTYKNNTWKYLVSPFSIYCNMWDTGVDFIKKDKKRPGYVTIIYTDFDLFIEGKEATITKSIPVNN